jgi:type IV pilus assembly protein PilE
MKPAISRLRQDQRCADADEWQPLPHRGHAAPSIIVRPCADRSAAEPNAAHPRCGTPGFTLIELAVAMAVAALLCTVAMPSFEAQWLRSRRADAYLAVLQVQAAQERFRSDATRYGFPAEIGMPALSPASRYALQLTAVTPEGYEVTAIALGTQARDHDCRQLRLQVAGGNRFHSSGADAALSNPDAANRRCWNL